MSMPKQKLPKWPKYKMTICKTKLVPYDFNIGDEISYGDDVVQAFSHAREQYYIVGEPVFNKTCNIWFVSAKRALTGHVHDIMIEHIRRNVRL